MIENKRDLLQRAFNNEEVERVPLGFWHHFVVGEEQFKGLEEPEILERVIQGHIDYYNLVNPDMMKIMNEGFFGYPPIMNNSLSTAEDLKRIQSIGPNHPWITKQVEHVKKLVDHFGSEVMTFYNVFAPVQVIRIRLEFLDLDFERFAFLAENYPEELRQAANEIEKDIRCLIEKLFTETKLDGIYYCVQNIQSDQYNKEKYDQYIRPTELDLLKRANELSDNNILHICGYAGHLNDLKMYQDYPAKVYNWATYTEGVSIEEGRKLFKNHCILGGFDNNENTLIDTGTKEEIFEYVRGLIDENGYRGYVIGADCSIPNDIDDQQVKYVSDASHQLIKE